MANQTRPKSLQETFAPHSVCFGCGPANQKGLQIKSFATEDGQGPKLIASWQAKPHHEAFPGMLNGGIIGALLDCHFNWMACSHLMTITHLDAPPCTVTAWFNVKLHRPTPSQAPLALTARPIEVNGHKVKVAATLQAADAVCATCEGLFVAVKEGHPAYNRWA